MFELLSKFIINWLLKLGFSEKLAIVFSDFVFLLLLIIACYLFYFFIKYLITIYIKSIIKKSKTKWDNVIHEKKTFNYLAYLIPLLFFNLLIKYVIPGHELTLKIIKGIVSILIIFILVKILMALLNVFHDSYNKLEIAKSRPIKSYIQVGKVVIYILFCIAVVTILFGDNSFGWIAGLGAFSAVLMLIFKDPILGFVGGIQLSYNNMVHIGDWITMPKYNADGNIIDITLTTVKVQNFDKTIITIPTYSLITDSFQNWRGMEESKGRRIKRSINIDMNSVKFCSPQMIEKFKSSHYLKKYIEDKEQHDNNSNFSFYDFEKKNKYKITNLGIFRAYLKEYLKQNPEINTDMTFLVRLLQPSEKGIPLEIYIFSKNKDWAAYEDIQSDIFDHILSVISEFELKIFQAPTGNDFKKISIL